MERKRKNSLLYLLLLLFLVTGCRTTKNVGAGNIKGNLKPTESITREEFAQIMKNILLEQNY